MEKVFDFVAGGMILFLLIADLPIGIVMTLFYGGIDYIVSE